MSFEAESRPAGEPMATASGRAVEAAFEAAKQDRMVIGIYIGLHPDRPQCLETMLIGGGVERFDDADIVAAVIGLKNLLMFYVQRLGIDPLDLALAEVDGDMDLIASTATHYASMLRDISVLRGGIDG